jgi:alkylation response protein AidB-like acyl-CoA dehydrogenase
VIELSLTEERQELQERTFAVANDAIQVYDNAGYSAKESLVKQYFRNSHAPMIYESTSPLDKMMQAEHAPGYRGLICKTGKNR